MHLNGIIRFKKYYVVQDKGYGIVEEAASH